MNVQQLITGIVAGNLLGNISTLTTHALTLRVYTDTNLRLSSAWTTEEPNKNSQMWQDYEYLIGTKDPQPGQMQYFIDTYMSSTKYLSAFSQAFGIQVMQALQHNWDTGSGSPSSSQSSIISNFINLISSAAQQQGQIGQNMVKTEGSVIQNDSSAQGNLTDVGTSVAGVGSNIASLLAQTY